MTIGELFDTAIEERIEPVIKVSDTADARKLASEIGSYVVTPMLETCLDDILEHYTDTIRTQAGEIGIWISGYFGSGKSHFAKVLSLLAGNPVLEGISACDRFVPRIPQDAPRRASILRSLSRIPSCDTRVLAFNLNTLTDSRSRPLPQLLLSQHYQSLGYSSNFIYARVIEAELDRQGKLAALHEAVERRARKPWDQVRNNLSFYRSHLYAAACEVAPDVFATADDVQKSLQEAQSGEIYSVNFLVDALMDDLRRREADCKRPQRLMLVLDESGQWIENDGGRLAQLQALIEQAATIGQGRIWIVVTTHGDMASIFKEARALKEDFKKIEGRFRFKPTMTTENIERVLEDRLFRKKPAATRALTRLYDDWAGVLRNVGEPTNTNQILPACTPERFATYYPFFPYQVHLIPEIVKSLRSKGGRGEQMTGSTRTLLAITQDILRAGRRRYLGLDVGAMVSFDELYANLVGEGEITPNVRTELSRVKDVVPGATSLTPRVTEVLYLIRELPYVPRTVDNLARLLVERVDDDLQGVAARVLPELDRLIQARMVARVGEEYEFLTGERRTFEEEVSRREGDVLEQDRERGLAEHFVHHSGESHWRAWLGSNVVSYLGKEFAFRLRVDETAVPGTVGEVTLSFVSPLESQGSVSLPDLESLSLRSDEQQTIFFLSGGVKSFKDALNRFLALRETIEAWKSDPHKSEEARRLAVDCERDALAKARDEVTRAMVEGIRGGTLVFRGASVPLRCKPGTKPSDALRAEMSTLWGTIYLMFGRVPVRIANDQKAIQDVLAGSASPGPDVRDLQLYDRSGKLDPHCPLLDAIRIHLSLEQNAGRRILGKALVEKFSAPPYGWDGAAVRVGIAALVRAGMARLLVNKKPYANPADPELIDAMRVTRNFDRVEIVLEETDVEPDVLTETRAFLIRLARRRSIDETPAALSEVAGTLAVEVLARARTVTTWANGSGMPLPRAFMQGKEAWGAIQELNNPVQRVREVHACREELADGQGAIEAYAGFQERSGLQYRDLAGLVRDLQPLAHRLEGEKAIMSLLGEFELAQAEASFGDPEVWRRLQGFRAQALLELRGAQDRWREDARARLDAAVTQLHRDVEANRLDADQLTELSCGFQSLRDALDQVTAPSQVASLGERVQNEERRARTRIVAMREARPPEGDDPRPRLVKRLRPADVAKGSRFQDVEHWMEFVSRLDQQGRALLEEGFEVELT